MDPVLFHFQTFTVYTFGFCLTVAVLVSTFLIWRRLRQFQYNELAIIDMVLVSSVVALILARVSYVITHWSAFSDSFLKMILITYFPGLDGIGAMVGVFLTVCLFTYLKRWKAVEVFDSVFIALGLGITILMLGSFFSGSLPGVKSYLPWTTLYPGLIDKRHPIPLYWMIGSLAYFVVVVLLDRFRRISGIASALFCYVFSAMLFILTPITDLDTQNRFLAYSLAVAMLMIAALLSWLVWRRLPYWNETGQTDDQPKPIANN